MDLPSVIEAIDRGKLDPVYFLVGAERFWIDRAIEALRRRIDETRTGFNVEVFDGPSASASGILNAARTLPMFGAHRLVLVRQADQIDAAELEGLLPYLAHPAPTTTLVLVATQLDGRKKHVAEAKRRGMLHDAQPLRERQVPSWIAARARERKVTIEADAAQALAQAVGTSLSELDDALERLALFVGPGQSIDAEAVASCVGTVRPHTVFELLDAVGAGDRAKALLVLRRLFDAREAGLKILWWVSRHLRQLLLAREAGRLSSGALASKLGVPPFVAEKIAAQAARLPPERLRRGLLSCAEADRELKGSRRPETIVLEQLVVALASK